MSQRSLPFIPRNALKVVQRWQSAVSAVMSLPALVALLLLCLSTVVFERLHWATEERQNFLFPLILLCLWRLPRPKLMRFPLWILVALLGSWAVAKASLHGLLPSRSLRNPHVFFATEKPIEEMVAQGLRAFIAEYNNLASLQKGSKIKSIHRAFSNEQKAREWLSAQTPGSLLVDARSDWFDVYLQTPMSQPEIAELRSHGRTFFVMEKVPLFQLPQEPSHLSTSFLLSLSQSQVPVADAVTQDLLQRELSLEERDAALFSATQIDGHWKTHVPRAAAEFLHGTSALIRYAEQQEPGWLSCALRSFQAAAGRVRQKENAELRAAIFNNAAVTLLLSSPKPKHLTLARRWLQIALLAKTGDGKPTSVSLLALKNLQHLGGS